MITRVTGKILGLFLHKELLEIGSKMKMKDHMVEDESLIKRKNIFK